VISVPNFFILWPIRTEDITTSTPWIEGNLTNNQAVISEHIVKFYKKLFEEQCQWRLRVDGLVFDQILDHEAGWFLKRRK
jgi:hypothetical protein